MTLLTEATDVFAAAERSGRCLVAFAAKRQPLASGVFGADQARRLNSLLLTLQAEGWLMSVRAMFELDATNEPHVFDTGFAHDADMVGAFEAPSLSAALAGTIRLEQAGWAPRFATQWLLGPREFSTVQGRRRAGPIIPGAFSRFGSGMTPGPPRPRRSAAPMTRNATSRSRAMSRLASTLLDDIDSIGRAAGITLACGRRLRSAPSISPCKATRRRRISSSRPHDIMSAGFARLLTS